MRVRRRRGRVWRGGSGRRGGREPAPPAGIRLRPPGRSVAVPLSQLPGATAGGGTRPRHADLHTHRRDAFQAAGGRRGLHRRGGLHPWPKP